MPTRVLGLHVFTGFGLGNKTFRYPLGSSVAGTGLSQSAGVGQDVSGYCNRLLRCAENNENNHD